MGYPGKQHTTRTKILVGISIILLLCSLIGMGFNDWTSYIIIIPFGWLFFGVFIEGIINGNHKYREPTDVSIFCAFILFNLAIIIVHRDTLFIIGRLLASIGAAILIISISKDGIDTAEKDASKEISRLKAELQTKEEQINQLCEVNKEHTSADSRKILI